MSGAAAVSAEWRSRVGTDFDLIRGLLTPDPDLAETFPRLDGLGEPFAVVPHGPDDYAGVGEEDERIKLTRADLVVYRLSPVALLRAVAGTFGTDPDGTHVEGLAGTYQVGLYRPLAGYDFPIYLTIQLESPDYKAAVEALLARTSGSFLLLAPTNRHHRIAARFLLEGRKCAFFALADAICVSEAGTWELTDAARGWLSEFRLKVLPVPGDAPGRVFFPTPAATRWSDVQIRFIDGDRVSAKVGAVTQTLTYAQMGLADGRNAKCTKQWELLRTFARYHGTVTWGSRGADKKLKKQCETLVGDLKSFFRIPGEPITLTADRKGWRTVFVIESD
jgi:hypothetical protein